MNEWMKWNENENEMNWINGWMDEWILIRSLNKWMTVWKPLGLDLRGRLRWCELSVRWGFWIFFPFAFGSDFFRFQKNFGKFWQTKIKPEIDFWEFFFNVFCERDFGIGRFWKLEILKIELLLRREHDFCKIDASEKWLKHHRFWLRFWKPERKK